MEKKIKHCSISSILNHGVLKKSKPVIKLCHKCYSYSNLFCFSKDSKSNKTNYFCGSWENSGV